jgi:hypothetical protein
MEKQQAITWRELLGKLTMNVRERRRLAEAASVTVATLQRWVKDHTMPREEHLVQLLSALPEDVYPTFLHLAAVDFPGLLHGNKLHRQELEGLDIPPTFYQRVLSTYAQTPWPMCFQAILDLLTQQIIELLDAERQGLAISIVRCMPPDAHGHVLSLLEVGGRGTHPWKPDLGQKVYFYGAESLVGHALSHFMTSVVNSRREQTFYPAHWTDHENSAAAFPILRHALVAGGLVVSSTREGFFTGDTITLLEYYANLAALLFEPRDFFKTTAIQLRVMPHYQRQEPFFADFNQRVSRKFAFSRSESQITLPQARLSVLQDLEAEMLLLPGGPEPTK